MKQGYLIVKEPRSNLECYESSCAHTGNEGILRRLRSTFACFAPEKYRGISRSPLEGDSWDDPAQVKALEDAGIDMTSNREARARLDKSIDESDDSYDICLIPRLEDALCIHELLDQPSQWEIVHVRRAELLANDATLGFDVGYWNGDHFSLIADTIVTPMWHPPDPKDWNELLDRLSGLNEHLLFTHPEHAAAFRTWYTSKPWAETEGEPGEFYIIQVDLVPPPCRSTTPRTSH